MIARVDVVQTLGVGNHPVGRREVDAEVQGDVEAALQVVQEVERLLCRYSRLTLGAVVDLESSIRQRLTLFVEQSHLVAAQRAQFLVRFDGACDQLVVARVRRVVQDFELER